MINYRIEFEAVPNTYAHVAVSMYGGMVEESRDPPTFRLRQLPHSNAKEIIEKPLCSVNVILFSVGLTQAFNFILIYKDQCPILCSLLLNLIISVSGPSDSLP